MVQLKLVEDSQERLSFKVGAFAFIGQMIIATIISLVVGAALTLFLRHWIGSFLAMIFFAFPGLFFASCGIIGCFNARSFTFTFDKVRGVFDAVAGSAILSIPLAQIALVYIERECQSESGMFGGNSPPTFSVTLLLTDGNRCHLEGGVAIEGTDRGPSELHAHCERISTFIGLPSQAHVPLLELTKSSKPEPVNDAMAQERLARWLTCAGLSPKLEPPLYEYNWLFPPQSVALPRLASRPIHLSHGHVQYSQVGSHHTYAQRDDQWGSRVAHGQLHSGARMQSNPHAASGPVVMGRVCGAPQQPQRQAQVVVTEGMQGREMDVQAPDGTLLRVNVPDDVRSGETITLQY